MNTLARLLRIIALIAFIYCIVLLVWAFWPMSLWLLIVVVIARYRRRAYRYLTTLGSARFATRREIKRAGMLNGKSGLIVGRLV